MATLPVVNELDKRKGILAAFVVMLLLFLYLYFTEILMADPPPRDIPVQIILLRTVITPVPLHRLLIIHSETAVAAVVKVAEKVGSLEMIQERLVKDPEVVAMVMAVSA